MKDMKDLLKKSLSLGLGFAIVSKEQIDKVIDELVTKGELSANESKEFMNELIVKGEEQQNEINVKLKAQITKIMEELNLPSKAEFEGLEKRISQLEKNMLKE